MVNDHPHWLDPPCCWHLSKHRHLDTHLRLVAAPQHPTALKAFGEPVTNTSYFRLQIRVISIICCGWTHYISSTHVVTQPQNKSVGKFHFPKLWCVLSKPRALALASWFRRLDPWGLGISSPVHNMWGHPATFFVVSSFPRQYVHLRKISGFHLLPPHGKFEPALVALKSLVQPIPSLFIW